MIVRDRRTGAVYTRARNVLHSPHHIQENAGKWYVSDVETGRSSIVVFSTQWEVERRIPTDTIASAPHQFAVLTDGRIVVEAPGGRLAAISDDSVTTFALVEQSTRTGFVVAAQGGVLHVVPGRAMTLYNQNGNIRWRYRWRFSEAAYLTDLAADAQGRMHLLLGEEGTGQFFAFTLSNITGEVIRWSTPGPSATFVVERMGEIKPDSAARWIQP